MSTAQAIRALDELHRLFAAPAGDLATPFRLLGLATELHNGLGTGAIQRTRELARWGLAASCWTERGRQCSVCSRRIWAHCQWAGQCAVPMFLLGCRRWRRRRLQPCATLHLPQ